MNWEQNYLLLIYSIKILDLQMKPFLPMILITLKQYYTIYEFVSGFVLLVVENIGGTECPVSSGEYAYY